MDRERAPPVPWYLTKAAAMPIRFITPVETHALRQAVLRPSQPLEEMEWSMDRSEGSFHVGMEEQGVLICVASFLRERNDRLRGWIQYRLRGMATAPACQGLGHGAQVLRFGTDHARHRKADLVWCHARERAVPFYAREDFLPEGEPFPIEGIGIHQLMYLRL